MNRKKFIKKLGIGVVVVPFVSTNLIGCSESSTPTTPPSILDPNACAITPTEIEGPFPNKTPSQVVKENIVGNRSGIPITINFTIENTNANCLPLEGALVDIWHCDAKGNYSEYSGQLDGNFTNENFLRGRQTSNASGKVSFVSIYPGWYPGRAPHFHVQVRNSAGTSLLITQTAFPEEISKAVYATTGYKGVFDTSNTADDDFSDTLALNVVTVTGNITDGFTITKSIRVAG